MCGGIKFLAKRKTDPAIVHIHPQRWDIVQESFRPAGEIVRLVHVLQPETVRVIPVRTEKRVVLDGKRNRALLGVRLGKDCGGTQGSCKSNGLHWVAI